MSLDRTITWPASCSTVPTREQLGILCRDYTRGLASRVRWHGGRWYIDLPGESRHALHRLAKPRPYREPGWKRWIEVWAGVVGDRYVVDVMTRLADGVTNAIADGLAAVIARFWTGERGAS